MLSHAEVAAVVQELGLGEVGAGLIEALRPAYRLEPASHGAHRIGGEPDLTAGEAWPRTARGIELTFIAQFDVGALPGLPGAGVEVESWRSTGGFVRLFADLYDDPSQPTVVTALIADSAAPRTRAPAPSRSANPAVSPELVLGSFTECAVDATPCWCLEPSDPAVEQAVEIDPGGIENAPLLELTHRLHAGRSLDRGWHVMPQLLGPPQSVQDDPRFDGAYVLGDPALDEIEAWTLLLQFDDTFAYYGDGGGFFLVIPRADLAAGRYDRAVALSQCF